ncbi:tetratricopeptide repeat protein [Solimicrobium silvestre]|uniref:Tetratricopeptide repeat n=1 Tax=Solimicrobium silvestre TaxID=2099400 RepID=A0A2S9H4S4_9BURK|nr:tetratricopeptide repeat protein [Solimicrobium silvestre]PRC94979.1 Tetratricopeptide repeat [Solimicrobium silvestre]
MNTKSVFQATFLSLAILCSAPSFAAEEPSMQQVYDTAKAGRVDEAQTMMQKVLQDHPSSAKAHFVEAELLAKQGRIASAQAELSNADRLAPGLPFAKPEAVENLRRLIANPQRSSMPRQAVNDYAAPANTGMPWGLILVGLGLIGFIIFAVRFMSNRNPPVVYSQNGATGYGSGVPMQPYGAPGQMMGGGGIGSGIVGGLVTGAALGAGMVAGEELMHHFTDGDNRNNSQPQPTDRNDYVPQNDMGGNDFGIADNSSWDSGGGDSGGGGDW